MAPEEENPYNTPRSDLSNEVAKGQRMQQLPRISTWYVLGLMILTLGLYYPYWLYTRTEVINRVHNRPIAMNTVIAILVLYALSQVLSFMDGFYSGEYQMQAGIIGLLSAIANLYWVFMVRNRINEMAEAPTPQGYWLSGIITFFLHVLYMQYKINEYHDLYTDTGTRGELAV